MPETNGTTAWEYLRIGVSESNNGNYEAAIASFTEAIRLKPDFPEAYKGRGDSYTWLNQHDKAISDFNDAIRLKPDFSMAYENRANSYGALGDTARAGEDREKAKRARNESLVSEARCLRRTRLLPEMPDAPEMHPGRPFGTGRRLFGTDKDL